MSYLWWKVSKKSWRFAVNFGITFGFFGFWHCALYLFGWSERPFLPNRRYRLSKVIWKMSLSLVRQTPKRIPRWSTTCSTPPWAWSSSPSGKRSSSTAMPPTACLTSATNRFSICCEFKKAFSYFVLPGLLEPLEHDNVHPRGLLGSPLPRVPLLLRPPVHPHQGLNHQQFQFQLQLYPHQGLNR